MAVSIQDIFSCDIHFKLTETQASRGPSVLPEFVPVEIVCGYYKAENNGAICSVLKWSQYTWPFSIFHIFNILSLSNLMFENINILDSCSQKKIVWICQERPLGGDASTDSADLSVAAPPSLMSGGQNICGAPETHTFWRSEKNSCTAHFWSWKENSNTTEVEARKNPQCFG